MRAILIITAAIAMGAISQAAETAKTAPATPAAAASTPAPTMAAAKAPGVKHAASKELIKKCKSEHKGDKKAYMECLKSVQ